MKTILILRLAGLYLPTPAKSTIALSRTKTAFKAQTALMVARGQQFESPLPDDGDGQAWHTVFKTDEESADDFMGFMPNPATGGAELTYRLAEGEIATLKIFDITGHLTATMQLFGNGIYRLPITTYRPGVYPYTITIGGKTMFKDKLVIIR